MSGRTILVGQVWEHWANKRRFLVTEIYTSMVVGVDGGDHGVFCTNETITLQRFLRDYFYVAELGQ